MTEEELEAFLAENKDFVMRGVREAILVKVGEYVKWNLPDSIGQTVKTFIEKEIAPEVAKALADQKGVLVEAAKKSAAQMSDALCKTMMEQVVKGLNGHRAEDVFKAMMGISSRY